MCSNKIHILKVISMNLLHDLRCHPRMPKKNIYQLIVKVLMFNCKQKVQHHNTSGDGWGVEPRTAPPPPSTQLGTPYIRPHLRRSPSLSLLPLCLSLPLLVAPALSMLAMVLFKAHARIARKSKYNTFPTCGI